MTDPIMAHLVGGYAYRLTDRVLAQHVEALGLCRDQDTERWYPNEPSRSRKQECDEYERKARQACSGCSVRHECLLLALRYEAMYGLKAHGFWGGTAPWERERLARTLRRRPMPLRGDDVTEVTS